MKYRYGLAFIVVLVLVGILGFVKYLQISMAIAQQAGMTPPPTAVTSVIVKKSPFQSQYRVVGSISAVQGAVLSAELPGRVAKIVVNEGDTVQAGAILIELDTTVEQADLDEALAKVIHSEKRFARTKALMAQTALSQKELEDATWELQQARAHSESLRSVLSRKIIKAPFPGKVGIRKVNVGQYVQAGAEMIPLYSDETLQIDFSVPQKLLGEVKAGGEFSFLVDAYPNEKFAGKVHAVDSKVDEMTRTVMVRGISRNDRQLLKPGMFCNVEIGYGSNREVLSVPLSSISFAPYGDLIWLITKTEAGMTASSVPVKIGERRGDLVVVDSGLEVGQEVITSGIFKLNPGMPVVVRNEFAAPVSAEPNPKDT